MRRAPLPLTGTKRNYIVALILLINGTVSNIFFVGAVFEINN